MRRDHAVIFFSRKNGNEYVLACPLCCNSYLHHSRVVTYDRSEDASRVLRTIVDGGTAQLDWVANDKSNPSPRRHGLAIEFCCENCSGKYQLTIAQHKGETFIGWR
jgi:hypothetical protein